MEWTYLVVFYFPLIISSGMGGKWKQLFIGETSGALSGCMISPTFLWVLGRCCIFTFKIILIIIMVWKLGFFPIGWEKSKQHSPAVVLDCFVLQAWLCSDLGKFGVFCIIFLIWMVKEDKFWVADYDCGGILRKPFLSCPFLPAPICINSSRFPGSAEKLVKQFSSFSDSSKKASINWH